MTTEIQPDKIIADIEECVSILKHKCTVSNNLIIIDECSELHHFEEMLEFIFQHGLKEKSNPIEEKASYWKYITECNTSSEICHSGLQHIKFLPELITSVGRGRAFIRFCLNQESLADMLQNCFTNDRVTKNFYMENALPRQQKFTIAVVEAVYKLKGIRFFLSRNDDLDISWPKYSKESAPFLKNESSSHNERDNLLVENYSSSDQDLKFQINILQDKNSKLLGKVKFMENLLSKQQLNKKCTECDYPDSIVNNLKSVNAEINCEMKVDDLIINNPHNKSQETLLAGSLHTLSKMKCLINNPQSILPKSIDITLIEPLLFNLKFLSDDLEMSLNFENTVLSKCLFVDKFCEKRVKLATNLALTQLMLVCSLEKKVADSIKESDNLFTEICALKDILQSYGLLKHPFGKHSSQSVKTSSMNEENVHEPSDTMEAEGILNEQTSQFFCAFKTALSRLKTLNLKVEYLQARLRVSQLLHKNIISTVQKQEMHLKDVTKELEKAQNFIFDLKERHKKLQSDESIFKYDLQEKRKLLTKLKSMIECARKEQILAQEKTSKSASEYKNFRKEFSEHHKHRCEESDFDKEIRENNDMDVTHDNFEEEFIENHAVCNLKLNDQEEMVLTKTRLDLLEEQSQQVHLSLVQSSKKQKDLDIHLDCLCKRINRNQNKGKTMNSNTSVTSPDSDPNISGTYISEDSYILENYVNSVQSSFEIENPVNSEKDISVSDFSINTVQTDILRIPSNQNPFHYNLDNETMNEDNGSTVACSHITIADEMDVYEKIPEELTDHKYCPNVFRHNENTGKVGYDIFTTFIFKIEEMRKWQNHMENICRRYWRTDKDHITHQDIKRNNLKIINDLENTYKCLKYNFLEFREKYMHIAKEMVLSKVSRDQNINEQKFSQNTKGINCEQELKVPCNLCGKICCHLCMDNWLLTMTSKQKLLVCDECYMQKLKMKILERESSYIPCLSNNEECSGKQQVK